MFSCSDINLVFEKEGYETLQQSFPADNPERIIVYLKKDLSAYSDIRPAILDTVRRLEESDFISTGAVGYAARKPRQYDRRIWLQKNATDKELIRLTTYPNAVVKATAFHGLFRKKHKDVPQILVDFSDQSGFIEFVSGCLGEPIHLGEYCFTEVMNYESPWDNYPSVIYPNGYRGKVGLGNDQKELIIANIVKHKENYYSQPDSLSL
ncbi:MAG: hypothetical protein HRT71_14190 [Flavobacteriales bacterium]|nr:hypothetical protein [Flavobacteriales bacterium]